MTTAMAVGVILLVSLAFALKWRLHRDVEGAAGELKFIERDGPRGRPPREVAVFSSKRLLIACSPSAVFHAISVFGDYSLSFTHRVEDAKRRIRQDHFDGVIATLEFDESRLFDLVPATLAREVPFIAVKLNHSILAPDSVERALVAARAAGAVAGLNLQRLLRELGPVEGRAAFLSRVEAALELRIPPSD